jgi:hypothetical protein
VIVVLRLLIGSSIDTPFGDVDLDRKFGLILATVAAIAVAVGGFQKSQEGDTATPGGAPGGTAPF